MPSELLDSAPGAAEDVDVFPASFAQARLWLLEQVAPRGAYTVPWGFRLLGSPRADCLDAALKRLIARHETLRTTFGMEDGVPVQRVHPELPSPLLVDDFSALPRGEALARADALAAHDAAAPFDLVRGPLLRPRLIVLAEGEAWLTLTLHHIIVDEWSSEVLLRELGICYNAIHAGREPLLEPLPIQYADYAVWQREWVASGASRPHADWWGRQLQGPLPLLDLPLDHPRQAGIAQPGATLEFTLPLATAYEVQALARAHQTTPFIVCLAAWAALLHRVTSQPEVIVGTPITDRSRPEAQGLIGFFLNMLPLRIDLSADLTFDALVERTRSTMLEAMQHQDLPFDHVVEVVQPERQLGRHPVFQTSFVYVVERPAPLQLDGLKVTQLPARRPMEAKFDLTLALNDADGLLSGHIEYRADLFDAGTIERLREALGVLLSEATATPALAISRLPLMAEAERHRLVVDWNDTRRPWPADDTLHQLLDEQALATPTAEAVRIGDDFLSSATLHARANQVAHRLRRLGVGPGVLVAVATERSLEMIVALLAVVKSGGTYVPIDPDYPADVLAFMLDDASAPVVLTQERLIDRLPPHAGATLCLDRDWSAFADEPETMLEVVARPGDAAYMIYTSGTTGRPKGALNSHLAIVNRLRWMREHFQVDERDTVLQKTPFSFDVSVWEIFLPLLTGARLVMARPGGHRDPEYLAALIALQQVTVVHFVPSMLGQFLASATPDGVRTLREVICSGEALPRETVRRCLESIPARLSNLYGPTEAAIDVTCWTCTAGAPDDAVPIGRPIANTAVYILDPNGTPTPTGIPGELHIGGVQVGMGYHRRPELTAERFVPDPFSAEPGARLYRTGDRARWRADGEIEFLGRLDRQVKLRGVRIELAGVESVLLSLPGVAAAAVTVGTDSTGGGRLVAHVVPKDGSSLEAPAVRAALKAQLPDQMIPAVVRLIPTLPLLPSGKVDRTALNRTPVEATPHEHTTPPEHSADTTLELALRSIWSELLDVPDVGPDDDFFSLGGHSLLAARMVDELARGTGYQLPLSAMFEAATIRELIPRLLTQGYPARGKGLHPIQEGAAGAPAFFMCTGDLTGGGFYCRNLGKYLPDSHGLVAIPPLQPDAGLPPATVEGMAAAHLVDVRTMQPHGPYWLGGYCVGGLIAYEMARQLTAMGERVEILLLIDPSDPSIHGWLAHHLARAVGTLSMRDTEARLTRIAYLKRRVRALRALPLGERLATLVEYPMRRARRSSRGEVPGADSPNADSVGGEETLYQRTTRHHARAQHLYRHGRYQGPVELLLTDEVGRDPEIQLRAWRRVAPATVLHRSMAGHSEVVYTDLPQLLRELINRASDEGRR